MKEIKIVILENGCLPSKSNKEDAGFDVFATQTFTIERGQVYKHPLNFNMELPENTYAELTTKSGLGSKGMLVYAGIIDELYRGIPHVVCTNLTDTPIVIQQGQKLAQMIIHPYSSEYEFKNVLFINQDTKRGQGGFGSTGV